MREERWLRAILLAIPLCALALHAWLFRHWVVDDAYITYRYSRFLAEGYGPYFNVGEHVEGYTNFLLMLLLAGADWLTRPEWLPTIAKAIGLLSAATGVVCACELARSLMPVESRTRRSLASLLAGLTLAASPAYALHACNGLETTLFGALLISGVMLGESADERHRWRGSGAAFAAAILTRPEGILIFGASWSARLMRSFADADGAPNRRGLFLDAAVVALVVVCHLLFRHLAYDGEWLPNTFYAKLGGFQSYPTWRYIYDGAMKPFGGIPGVAIGIAGAALLGSTRRRWLVIAAPAVAGILSPLLVGVDWMPGQRFLVPYLPIAAALVASGFLSAVYAVRMPDAARATMAAALVALIAFSQQTDRENYRRQTDDTADGFRDGHAALALWLRERAAPGDAVAAMDIGRIGYELPQQRIFDITGLTDRTIAKSPGAVLDKHYPVSYLLDRDPRYIVLVFLAPGDPAVAPSDLDLRNLSPIENRLRSDPEFRKRYVKVRDAAGGAGWRDQLAASIGARAVFQHAFPYEYYLLAVFERDSAG